MYEFVGKTAPFLILAFLALFDGGRFFMVSFLRNIDYLCVCPVFFICQDFVFKGCYFLMCLSAFSALQLFILQPTKVEPEVSDPTGQGWFP